MAEVNMVALNAPFRWLAAGWRDLIVAPVPAFTYGAAIALVSFAIWQALIMTDLAFWALSLSCGFVFVAPTLAMGLYEASRSLGDGRKPTLAQMLFVRDAVRSDIFYLGLALLLIYFMWGRIAQIVYGLSTYRLYHTIHDFIAFAEHTNEGHSMLIAGTLIGGVMAFFTFALTVVSTPMLLDRRTNVFEAVFTSMASVSKNLPAMLVWALLITLLLIMCAATAWLALALVFPWLGFASWHAYRDVVAETGRRHDH